MKAIILAAGTASRLRPLTLHTPKCLLKVGERTLLQRSMDALITAGIHDFVIVTGYLHQQIEDFVKQTYGSLPLREGRGGSFCFIHNKDYETTNNIYSLWLARPEAEGKEVLLLDSDLLYDAEIVRRVLSDKHENVLTLIRHELGEEEMKVVMSPNGTITEISKTCDPALAAGESLGIEKMGKDYTKALYTELNHLFSYPMSPVIFVNTHMIETSSSAVMPAQYGTYDPSSVFCHNRSLRIAGKKALHSLIGIIYTADCEAFYSQPKIPDGFVILHFHTSKLILHFNPPDKIFALVF